MAKTYIVVFGSGLPSTNTGMTPTFIHFWNAASGVTAAPPSISEINTTGLYKFTYGPTNAVGFVVDGGASLASGIRYVAGQLDPSDAIDEVGATLIAIGTTNIALGTTNISLGTTLIGYGNSLISLGMTNVAIGITNQGYAASLYIGGLTMISLLGSSASSFGSTSTNPDTIYGFLKRLQEFNEGNSTFNKTTGVWDIYSRGSSTLLAEKTLADTSTSTSKT